MSSDLSASQEGFQNKARIFDSYFHSGRISLLLGRQLAWTRDRPWRDSLAKKMTMLMGSHPHFILLQPCDRAPATEWHVTRVNMYTHVACVVHVYISFLGHKLLTIIIFMYALSPTELNVMIHTATIIKIYNKWRVSSQNKLVINTLNLLSAWR